MIKFGSFFVFCFVFVLRTQRLCKKTMAHVFCLEKKIMKTCSKQEIALIFVLAESEILVFRLFVLSGSSDAKDPILNLPIHISPYFNWESKQTKNCQYNCLFLSKKPFFKQTYFFDFRIHRFRIGYLIQRTRYAMFCFGTY